MIASPKFGQTISYQEAAASSFDALLLPGGHDKASKPYRESQTLQSINAELVASDKPVAAICDGVLVLARSKGTNGNSVIHGRKVTSLTNRLRMTAYHLTRLWMGDYYRPPIPRSRRRTRFGLPWRPTQTSTSAQVETRATTWNTRTADSRSVTETCSLLGGRAMSIVGP